MASASPGQAKASAGRDQGYLELTIRWCAMAASAASETTALGLAPHAWWKISTSSTSAERALTSVSNHASRVAASAPGIKASSSGKFLSSMLASALVTRGRVLVRAFSWLLSERFRTQSLRTTPETALAPAAETPLLVAPRLITPAAES